MNKFPRKIFDFKNSLTVIGLSQIIIKLKNIESFPVPKNREDVKKCVGLTSYFINYVLQQ